MPVSVARAAAFDILLRVEREQSYASELLHSPGYGKLSAADHALATELVMGVMRWRSVLDQTIAASSAQKLARLDLEILIALRMAAYQFGWLDRIPQRAALHESVELVKRARKRSAAPFVNAVLRKVSGAGVQRGRGAVADTAADIAENCAHPQWMVGRWLQAYGVAAARAICAHDQEIPETVLRLRSSEVASQLETEGVKLSGGKMMSAARRVESGDVTKNAAFRHGGVAIQDEASQLVAALVGRGSKILDCCAAPGGKTSAMADRNPEAEITAVEIHPHRARLLRNLTERKQSPALIRVIVGDTTKLPTAATFDRVLADVPCSGTGTLGRNPEIKWKLRPEDLADLQVRQIAILQAALSQVGAGGRVVYSTCSLEPEENEDVVQRVLVENSSFRVVSCSEELRQLKNSGELIWENPESLVSGPYLRTIPGVHPCDGFFAAIVEKG